MSRMTRGQILPGVLIILLVLLIVVPAMVVYVQNESVMTLKQKRSTVAFYAAQAGIDRAVWLLRSSTSTYNDVLDGDIPAGYLNDVVYDDVSSGEYRIILSSTDVSAEVRIEAQGRDKKAKEFRRIEALVSKDAITAAIYAATLTSAGSAKVYWGPTMSLSTIQLSGGANKLYPRKFARGSISAGGYYPDRDVNSGGQNTDGVEWWSYNEPPGVPDPPSVRLNYYREQAKLETGCPAGGTPAGSCYYTTNQTISGLQDMTPKAYFFEANASFGGTKHFRGHLIVMGDLSIAGNGKGAAGGNDYGEYTTTIPANAYKEYQKNTPAGGDDCLGVSPPAGCGGGGDGNVPDDGDYNDGDDAEGDDDCCHQYPGDHGAAATGVYKFGATGCVDHNERSNATNEPIHFKGFIYVKGNSGIAGQTAIHGTLLSDSGSFNGSGSFSVFYDDSLEVEMTDQNFTQTSWKELVGTSF